MKSIGVIAEYNPFHNGHLYHLQKIKEMFPKDIVIVVLGGHFMQRGETSIINKWDKTNLALTFGADIIIELPFPFATQSADFFARGALEILNYLKVETIVFGSESNNIELLKKTAEKIIIDDDKTKIYLDQGFNYPHALSKSLNINNNPNDILGITYIKEIIKNEYKINPLTILRTNDYHGKTKYKNMVSASYIRENYQSNRIKKYLPKESFELLKSNVSFLDNYFAYLKYQIIINLNQLDVFQGVEEGIENRIKKYIFEVNSIKELIGKIKCKRYTYNRIQRMLTHILCGFTKEDSKELKKIKYLRVLGFNKKGQTYLNKIKKETEIPIVTNLSKHKDPMLDLELKTTKIYSLIFNETYQNLLIKKEYNNLPLKRD